MGPDSTEPPGWLRGVAIIFAFGAVMQLALWLVGSLAQHWP
jgi:hypothetical protein